MKKNLLILFSLVLMTICSTYAQDSWVQKASLLSPVNTGSYGCSIGNRGYVIPGGSPGSYFENAPKNDFGNTILLLTCGQRKQTPLNNCAITVLHFH